MKDLGFCANTLKNLNWINTYSLPKVSLSASSSLIDNYAMRDNFKKESPFLADDILSLKFKRIQDYPLSVLRITDEHNDAIGDPEPDAVNGTNYRIDKSSVLTDDRRFYEIGFFSAGKTSYFQQKFAIVVNKRTWPYSLEFKNHISGDMQVQSHDPYTENNNTHAMLSAIDARGFSATIDRDLSHIGTSDFKWKDMFPRILKNFATIPFLVTDYRDVCHPQQVKPSHNYFTIDLDPGEGTLLSIQPLTSTYLGCNWNRLPATVLFNNSRRVSSIETDPIHQTFQLVYPKEGGIAVSYPVEGIFDSSLAKRQLATPADSLIDSNYHCHDPAICANAEGPKSLGIVYYTDSTGSGLHLDSTSVIFRYANPLSPYAYSGKIVLDKYKTRGLRTTATPAITPAKSGCGRYWVSWRNPDQGGIIALLDSTGNVLSKKYFSAGDPGSTRFVSITSHLYRDPNATTAQSDTCYMAFEEGTHPTAQIYFLKAFCTSSGIDTAGLKNLSKGLPYCENHYPCISMTPTRRVMVTWEAIGQRWTWTDSSYTLHRTHYGILHGRYADDSWTSYLSLMGFDVPMTDGLVDTLSMFPVVSVSDWKTNWSSDSTWDDVCRYVWHSPFDEQVHMSHFGYVNGFFVPCFENVQMPDASLFPSLPERKMFNGVLQPLMYFHPTYAEDTSYSPQVTIYDFPLSTLAKAVVLKQQIIAKPLAASCGMMAVGTVDQVRLIHDTLVGTINWQPRDTIINDSLVPPPLSWNDSTIHTDNFIINAGDNLQYGRYFKLGNYQSGDTSALKSYLSGPSDYIKMKVNLRSTSTHYVIRTVDSCLLDSSGFKQSGSLSDSGRSNTLFTSPISGQVYLTFECTRGYTGNSFKISNRESYDDSSPVDEYPGPPFPIDSSFKKSQPISPQRNAFVSHINMMVRPNPFRTQTSVELEVPTEVILNVTIFDVLGKQVTTLFNNISGSTNYVFTLDSKQLIPGMYFVRVQAGGEVVTRKIEMVR